MKPVYPRHLVTTYLQYHLPWRSPQVRVAQYDISVQTTITILFIFNKSLNVAAAVPSAGDFTACTGDVDSSMAGGILILSVLAFLLQTQLFEIQSESSAIA